MAQGDARRNLCGFMHRGSRLVHEGHDSLAREKIFVDIGLGDEWLRGMQGAISAGLCTVFSEEQLNPPEFCQLSSP